uniref:Mitochondrial acidic protein mam33 n=2 Tax=Anthurium amnicola TaxID=1678845 RepID=A0A1D1XGD5_9ARAE
MERGWAGSPLYARQISTGSSSTGSSSPGMSPGHHRSASAAGALSSIKRTQNVAAKKAAARLAQVMASQNAADKDEDEDEDGDEGINQLFLHVDVSKPGREEALHFLCGLYPDAIGIHSVCLRPKVIGPGSLRKYSGRIFQELDQKMRDAFHIYVEERGLNESLFPFLQAWLYVKDHRNLMRWFKSVGTFVSEHQTTSTAISS